MSFSVTDFVSGPLKQYFRGRLKIEIHELDDMLEGPAEVIISDDKSDILLRSRRSIWVSAAEGDGEARRVIAHEIGHIWLHRDERFKFSEISEAEHDFIASEELVEWQAHTFGEALLMPLDAICGFGSISELIDYCDLYHPVPYDVIERRFELAQTSKRYHFRPIYGDCICQKCGSDNVRTLMTYQKCDNCGFTKY